MLKKEEYHWYYNSQLHEKKMSDYRRLLEKKGIRFLENMQLSA
jgi:hypothetical protein